MALLALPASLHAQLAPAPSGTGQSSNVTPAAAGPLTLAPAPPVRGRYVDAVPSVIRVSGAVSTGRRVTLAVDIAPRATMRVYAPGNANYSAVTLTVDPVKGVSSQATIYPKPDEYFFAPLNERVNVYATAFRLTKEVTVRPNPGVTSAPITTPGLVLTGRLEYQACDDKVCYLTQTLPLTWTIVN